MQKRYICPICGYPYLFEAPYGEDYKTSKDIYPSYEICPCCSCEFGYDLENFHLTVEQFRSKWLNRKYIYIPRKIKKQMQNLENKEVQELIQFINNLISKSK